MFNRKINLVALAVVVAAELMPAFSAGQVQAEPSLARQMGMDCSACRTMFPELTPFGPKFKLTAYPRSPVMAGHVTASGRVESEGSCPPFRTRA